MAWIEMTSSTLHRGIQGAAPLLCAAIGELIVERAGLVNIGIEGMMLTGALTAAAVGWAVGSAAAGVAAAAIAGAMVGLLFALWSVRGARDQIVTGLAINLLALGLTGVAAERIEVRAAAHGVAFVSPRLKPLMEIDGAAHPLLRAILSHDVLVFALAPLAIVTWLCIGRTRPGLSLRAVGENPEAADTAGIRVGLVRTTAAMLGGALAAVGGAYLVLVVSDRFQENMTAGRGFLALALVIFGRWSPGRVALAALFFGLLDAMQTTLQPSLGRAVHTLHPLLLALPYLLTLAALSGWVGRIHPPAALGTPYQRE